MKKIIYYYNGKKIVGTKESELSEILEADNEEVKYYIDGVQVSESIYRDVKSAINSF